jgi:hypothetical protein
MDAMTSPRARALALTVAATAAALVLAGCGDDPSGEADDPTASDDDSTSSSPSDAPSTTDPAPSESSDSGTPETVTVPIYFVGDGPRGPVLYREFRAVEGDNPMEEAVALLLAGDAQDPDYRSPVPGGGQVEGVSFDGIGADGSLQVVLADDSLVQRPDGMSKQDAELALQSVVYTLQGVAQARAKVVVVLDGEPTDFLGIDTSAGVHDAPQLDVLNLVSVTSPEEGATVSGSFTASGVGSSFEATIPWEIRQGDQVVQKGFATAEGWMDKLYPWKTEVDVSKLAPGGYVFAAMTDDPSGGEGFGPSEDTKTITVE